MPRPVIRSWSRPFGAAVIEAAVERRPAIAATSGRCAVRAVGGSSESLERAARDAEGVRRWFADEDRDFVVKIYAAVVSSDQAVERSATCAVIEPSQIPAWLRSLPAQRSLTEPARSAHRPPARRVAARASDRSGGRGGLDWPRRATGRDPGDSATATNPSRVADRKMAW
jgi:hypothetical protein